jgi:multiple sugar transport system permease protein
MREQRTAYMMIAPAVIILVLLIAYPFFISLYMSLTDKRIGMGGSFIGLRNYIQLLQGGIFWQVLENTLIYTLFAVAFKAVLGLCLALILQQISRGRKSLRGIVLLPWVVPATLSVLGWWWMFDPTFGVINWLLTKIGLTGGIPWLGDPFWARISVITVNVWRGLPFFAICFLAGLVSIPIELHEAAKVDGAGGMARFWHITLPLLKPILSIIILYSVVMTVSDFIIVQVLTRGGPLQKTHLFGTLAYQIGLAGTEIGMGAAISLFIFPILAISAYFMLQIIRRGEEFA